MDFKGGVGKFPYAHNWEGGTKHGGRRGGGGECAKNAQIRFFAHNNISSTKCNSI